MYILGYTKKYSFFISLSFFRFFPESHIIKELEIGGVAGGYIFADVYPVQSLAVFSYHSPPSWMTSDKGSGIQKSASALSFWVQGPEATASLIDA